jgi:tetratricopeptide (TPR) repeat protein
MRSTRALAALLIVGAAAGTGFAGARLQRMVGLGRTAEVELLYLPNGRHLRLMSLGHAPLVADMLYLWAIQYYANYQRSDRSRYIEHVFGNVITELDPHFVDPYWLGSMILAVEAGDLEAALRLLDKGFHENPKQWVFPYLAGWECYRAAQFDRAARYFDRAAAVPGAPPRLLRMRAGMAFRGGSSRAALDEWIEVHDDPRSDAATRAIAQRRIRDLRVRADLEDLDGAIRAFRGAHGRLPRQLGELVRGGQFDELPLDPDGQLYGYDPATGRVSSSAGRVLSPGLGGAR